MDFKEAYAYFIEKGYEIGVMGLPGIRFSDSIILERGVKASFRNIEERLLRIEGMPSKIISGIYILNRNGRTTEYCFEIGARSESRIHVNS